MIASIQIIAATCCLLLEIGSVLSLKSYTSGQAASLANNQIDGSNYPAPSYTPAALEQERRAYSSSMGPYGSASDLTEPALFNAAAQEVGNFAAADFADSAGDPQRQQAKIYESTMDRIVGPARPQASTVQASATTVGDLNTAAGHHHGHHHGKYYEYREVPKKKTWKFGYKRGNHKHHIERHEHGKNGKHPHFKTKVKWADKKSKGKGIHLWDYNHHDKKHYHHGK